jgi:hypothetical protein
MVTYLTDAKHKGGFQFWVQFNTGEEGEIDLEKILKNAPGDMGEYFKKHPEAVQDFYLDPWPTLSWKCGFDIAPERLYEVLICKSATQVAEEKSDYNAQ